MKSFKRILRLLGLVLLLVLASAGIGFVGGIPIPRINKKEDTIELKIESNKGKSALIQLDVKK